jgi:hypothetical protein
MSDLQFPAGDPVPEAQLAGARVGLPLFRSGRSLTVRVLPTGGSDGWLTRITAIALRVSLPASRSRSCP